MWAHEATAAVVPGAQTRYYLAQMLACKGDLERAHSLLAVLCCQFDAWDILVWQRKCAKVLATLHTGCLYSGPESRRDPSWSSFERCLKRKQSATQKTLCVFEIKVDTRWEMACNTFGTFAEPDSKKKFQDPWRLFSLA
jgi:hypothetical protein